MISFRLTDEEYERFRHLCISRGLRNVSELVRAAVNQWVGDWVLDQSGSSPEIDVRVANLELRMANMAAALIEMESKLPPSQASPAQVRFAQSVSGQ